MPIKNFPFTKVTDNYYLPMLNINIINPHSRKYLSTKGLIDTGADECAIPASLAKILGHNLTAGNKKTIHTGNGVTKAYSHTTKFEILHYASNKVIYNIKDTPIDFLPNLHVVLLGVKSFLSNFILSIDYPKKVFSIKIP